MKKILAITALLCMSASSVLALARNDLSQKARKLLPEIETTIVRMRNGEQYEGELVADNDTTIVIRVTAGGISSTEKYMKALIKSYKPRDAGELLGKALLRFDLDPSEALSQTKCRTAIALFDEFLLKCPSRPEAAAITKKRQEYNSELKALNSGRTKVAGRYLTKTETALARYEGAIRSLRELEKTKPGIARDNYRKDPEAKAKYERTLNEQRAIVMQLPKLVRESVPGLLAKGKFNAAAGQIDRLLKLWVNRVLLEEARRGKPKGGRNASAVLRNMDFSFIMKLEIDFMKAYIKKGGGKGSLPRSFRMPKGMVFVPGGYFLMGRKDASYGDPEFPMHIVFVESFIIDRCEVSNGDYNRFVRHVRQTGDSTMEHPTAPPLKDHASIASESPSLGADDLPVAGVDWFDAYAYANWAEKRLPTEAEWEKAARGMKMFKYPWGSKLEPKQLVINTGSGRGFLARQMDAQTPPRQPKKSFFTCIGAKKAPPPTVTTLPVTTWPSASSFAPQAVKAEADGRFKGDEVPVGASPYKLYHMAGNVAEWVNDYYDSRYYTEAPLWSPAGPREGAAHVYRGGSYLSPDTELVTTWRGNSSHAKVKTGCTERGQPAIGFRCVRTVKSTGGIR